MAPQKSSPDMHRFPRLSRLAHHFLLAGLALLALTGLEAAEKPHAVFVVGTPHYNPAGTLPPLAAQLEKLSGWQTTVVAPSENPEKNPDGIPGLEALDDADLAVFFLRFLTLPEKQFAHIESYVKSGRPVATFRTTSHAFIYPDDHPLARWNDGFGRRVAGTKYFIHSSAPTRVKKATDHEILTGVDLAKPRRAAGTLYLSNLPDAATVLLRGASRFERTGTVENRF